MTPDLSLLLAILLGMVSLDSPLGPSGGVGALRSLGGTAATVVVVWMLARSAADRAVRHLQESEPDGARGAVAWLASLPLVGWLAVLYGFGWGAFVGAHVPSSWFLARYVALFAPLGVLVAAGWVASRRVEAHLSPDVPTPWGAVVRGLRRNAIVLVPLGVLLVVEQGIPALAALGVPGFAAFRSWARAYPDLSAYLLLGLTLVAAYFSPAIFRRALRAQPLPDGEARRAIDAALDASGVRRRDVLLWRTGGRVANAMLVGLDGRTRYVFVTDGLLGTLPPAEVLAVVAHEAGHARRKHLLLYLVVSVSLVLCVGWAGDALAPHLGDAGAHLLPIAVLAVFWFGFVGWLSRRFEREADVFGAEHARALEPGAAASAPTGIAEGAEVFAAALERIGRHAGRVRTLRHGSIADRVAYLKRYAADPEVRRAFQRRRRLLLAAIGALAVAGVAGTVWRLPIGLARGRVVLRLERAAGLFDEGEALERRDQAAAARERLLAARNAFATAARGERRDDVPIRLLEAEGAVSAGEIDLRHLRRDAEAGAELHRALELLDSLRPVPAAWRRDADRLRFHALVDLGRLALREGEGGVAKAAARLDEARSLADDPDDGGYRRARLRLLDAAIRLRDPASAAAARRDLEAQAKSASTGEEWDALRVDARRELDAFQG